MRPRFNPWVGKIPGEGNGNYKVKELEKVRFRKRTTLALYRNITFNEARRGSSQISELLCKVKKRVDIYRKHIHVEIHRFEGVCFSS